MTRLHQPLRPPKVTLEAEGRWVLQAAFAEKLAPSARPASPKRAAELVERFNLTNAVASRLSPAQLEDALTPELARVLSNEFRRRVMRGLAVARVRQQVRAAATEARIEIAFLKQSALELTGVVTPQQRYATDIDLLIDPHELILFCSALERQGLAVETNKRHAHGVPVLRSQEGIGIELHTHIFDLRLPDDSTPLTLAALRNCGRIRTLDPDAPYILVPTLDVIAAHIVAQGWYLLHYVPDAPGHKSPFRVIADVAILGLYDNENLSQIAFDLIRHQVPADEFFGLVALVRHLTHGDLENLTELPRRLLDHAVASQLDETYRRQLIIPHQLAVIRSEGVRAYVSRHLERIWHPEGGLGGAAVTARWRVLTELARKLVVGAAAMVQRR